MNLYVHMELRSDMGTSFGQMCMYMFSASGLSLVALAG